VVTVRQAERGDVQAIAHILEELDRFYGATEFEPIESRIRQIRDAIFGEPPAGRVLLAWDEGQLVGLASYSFLWPAAGVTRSLFLKEVYVAQSSRRRGIGRRLMQELFDVAAKFGCSRIEWTTEADNEDALRFYAALNASLLPVKVFYRMSSSTA
jgi:GNAT superfamily N-acetyltransferase